MVSGGGRWVRCRSAPLCAAKTQTISHVDVYRVLCAIATAPFLSSPWSSRKLGASSRPSRLRYECSFNELCSSAPRVEVFRRFLLEHACRAA